jgi:type I restriction enzyme S subunit
MSSDQLGGSEILENFGISSIPSDWSVVRIEDILERERGISVGVMYPGAHHQGGVALLKVVDVRNNWISDAPDFKISPDKHQEYRRTELEGGELLITLVGQNSCQTAIVPESMKGWNAARAIAVTRIDPLKGSNHFIKYALQAPALQLLMKNWSNTTVQETLNLKEIRRIPMPMPPITEQKAIAHILGTLDDKIELNRKTNETLEAVAKALFKSWFVDFDPVRAKSEGRPTGLPAEISDLFPDSFEDSELGEIPSGWRVDSIYSIASVIYGAPFSSSLFNGDGDGIAVARIRDLPGETPGVFTTEVHSKGTLILPGDIVVGMDGEFRAYLWGGEECWMNQRVCKFIPSKKSRTCFLRESILKPLMDVERSETATTVIHLGKGDIDGFRLVVPSPDVLGIFSSATTPLYEEVVAKKQQTRVLANIRDALLPKLISGEIRIPDAERMLEEVGV